MLEYQSISALCAAAEEAGVSLSELVLRDQAEEMELPTEVLYQRMRENLQVMRQAIQAGSMPETRSLSGLTGGDAFKMKRYAQEGGIIGGFMNRSIARALAVNPEVLLMDEPTSALDPISTSKIEDLALELKEHYTVVMVTHNMQQAARISDNTAFFLLGELVEFGKTEHLFSAPADKRTEDYITGRFG